VLAFLVGFAGNLFSVGIAWNAAWWPKERQGFALGVFGAGNVGASVTKLHRLPTIIASTAGAMYLGIFQGGWRIFPAFYTVLLVDRRHPDVPDRPPHDKMNGPGQAKLGEMLAPLKHVRVWRFSLYYAAVFGAYVALSAWLPKYYVDNFGVDLQAGFAHRDVHLPGVPAAPVGGWFSDRWGARRVMYWTFGVMLATTGILMMPNGHLVIDHADGTQSEHLAYAITLHRPVRPAGVPARLRHGRRQGRRLQAHPRVLPRQRRLRRRPRRHVRRARRLLPAAAVRLHQGLVRVPHELTFFVLFLLTAVCFVWMHWTIVHMLHRESPDLARHLETPVAPRPSAKETSMSTAPAPARKGEWLESWDPENEQTWDKSLAWRTLWVTTFCLTLAFVAWFLPSAIVPKLNALGYEFSKSQLYWMAAMPGLAGGLLRLVWMVLPPIMGTRKMVSLTSLLLIAADAGLGRARCRPGRPLLGAHGAGLPRRHRRRRVLRLHAEHVVLLPQADAGHGARACRPASATSASRSCSCSPRGSSPWVPSRFFGGSQQMTIPGKEPATVWYQNAAFVWIPLMVVGAVLAWTMLKSVPVKANIRQQFDIFGNQDTWWMTLLYIMTFGTFSGLAAQFGLLMTNLYGSGNTDIVRGQWRERHPAHRRLRRAGCREVRLPRPAHRARPPASPSPR
jgi:NNP family nitrate/nitrite transporter-like MFS transporter